MTLGSLFFMTASSLLIMTVGFFVLISLFYRKAPEGFALIRNGMGGPKISLNGMIVIPVLHGCNLLGTTVQQIDHSVVLKDSEMNDIPVDISLYIKPNEHNFEDLFMVHKQIGADGLAVSGPMTNNFKDMAEQAVAVVAGKFTAKEIHQRSLEMKMEVIEIIGDDLGGFILEDLFIKPAEVQA